MGDFRIKRTPGGFTLVELIIILMIVGLLSVVFAHRLPSNMDEEAAMREFTRAIRLAQHVAMTRQYTTPEGAWGITVALNRYSVQRRGEDCTVTPETKEGCIHETDYLGRQLLNDSTMTLSGGPLWFNGLGEPIDPDGTITGTVGAPLATATTFTVASSRTVTVSPRTGYVQ